MPTRNPIKQFFVTFPQWTDNNAFILQFFHSLEEKPTYMLVARESHKDGGIHFHTAVKFNKGITKAQLIKLLCGYFPEDWKRIDVQPLKSWKDTFTYLTKEDSKPYEYGERPKVCKNINNSPKVYNPKDIAFMATSKTMYDRAYNDYKAVCDDYSEERYNELYDAYTNAMLSDNPDEEEQAIYAMSSYSDNHLRAKYFCDNVTLEDFRTYLFKQGGIKEHEVVLRGF